MTAPTVALADQGAAAARPVRTARIVTWICWFGLFSEGYDMGALGAVLPGLLGDRDWNLTPAVASLMASAALLGMFFGGYGFGVVSDRIGRKRCFIGCLALFSLASGAAGISPSPWLFGVLRFFAGVGVGGIVPVAAALVCEFAPRGGVNREFALMYSGYSLGILASALVSFFVLELHGWRLVIGLGALPLLALPAIAWLLPESAAFLAARGKRQEAARIAERFGIEIGSQSAQPGEGDTARPGVRALFGPGRARATLGFWFATFAGMILVYGLNTWLPQIMRDAGYDLGPSILFLGVFALASSVGGILLGWIADRFGRARTIVLAFTVGAMAILVLAHRWPLPLTYMIVAVAGVGTVSAAVMVTSYLSQYFPPTLRATAVGSCLSFSRFGAVCGPLVGGVIASYQLNMAWNFVVFAFAGALAACSIALVPSEDRTN